MRLSILPILLAGASAGEELFATLVLWFRLNDSLHPVSLVVAEPIRVIDSPSNANANIRFGHALANANVNGNDDSVARLARPPALVNPPPQDKNGGLPGHFCGASLREKALRLSNAFRHALGMPLIEANLAVPRPGEVIILSVGYPPHDAMLDSQGEEDEDGKPRKHRGDKRPHHPGGDEDHEHRPHHGHHGHRGHRGHGHKHRKSFLGRIHRATKALGPWEGRAVAFVLGKKSRIPLSPGLIYCTTRLWDRRSFEDVLGSVRSCLSHRAR